MGGGKGKAPPPPDYSQVAAANKEAAEISAAVAREQLAWAKEQYALDRADTNKVTDVLLQQMDETSEWARADRARYEAQYQPLEDQLVQEAQDYATPGRIEQEAGKAVAAVDQQYEAARQAAEARAAGYGLDPSQIRSGALDLGTRLQEASAKAAAANVSRTNTENVGRALRSEAINIGRGYPGQVAQSVAAAQGAGQGVVGANATTTGTGAQTMGTGVQWQGLANQALGNWGDYSARVYSAQQQARAAQGSIWGGIGTLAGAAIGKWSDPRVKENMRPVGKLDDGTPVYAYNYKGTGGPTELGVSADDVEQTQPGAVMRSPEGIKAVDYDRVADRAQGGDRYQIPDDVLRRKGTEFFDRLVDKTRGVPGRGKASPGSKSKAQERPSDGMDASTMEALISQILPPPNGAPAYG